MQAADSARAEALTDRVTVTWQSRSAQRQCFVGCASASRQVWRAHQPRVSTRHSDLPAVKARRTASVHYAHMHLHCKLCGWQKLANSSPGHEHVTDACMQQRIVAASAKLNDSPSQRVCHWHAAAAAPASHAACLGLHNCWRQWC